MSETEKAAWYYTSYTKGRFRCNLSNQIPKPLLSSLRWSEYSSATQKAPPPTQFFDLAKCVNTPEPKPTSLLTDGFDFLGFFFYGFITYGYIFYYGWRFHSLRTISIKTFRPGRYVPGIFLRSSRCTSSWPSCPVRSTPPPSPSYVVLPVYSTEKKNETKWKKNETDQK